ncbi:MAG: sugar ABC transporter substrate-binding protein [Synergistaceae bacterium]|jgi:ABC-type sugar transport system substrate-binding protein|nr:sugar ABC transporter substrate-binding protein [Synergistaceae bacterium]
MKKIQAVVVLSLAALSVVCFNAEALAASNGKTIAILMHSVADEFIYSVYAAADARAKELGYDTVFVDAKNDASVQAAAVDDAITKKVDGIMLTPVDASAMSDSVIKINQAEIPVVLADRTIEEGKFVAVCQSDNYEFGVEGARQIVAAAEKAGKKAADLKVLELQGDLASTSGLLRSQGFQKTAGDLGLKIVSSLPTYWRTDTASNAALDALQANPDINAVFLASDGVMGDAVINAFDQVGRLFPTGDEKHIIVTAVDGTPAAHELIKKRYIDATCAQPAILMAETAINRLNDAINGKIKFDANEDISLAPTIGTIDNIDSPDLWANSGKK